MKSIAWIACGLAATVAPVCAANVSGTATTSVVQMRTTNMGQPIDVPAHPTVIVTQTTIATGAHTPTHKHPFQRYVYVLEGTLTVVDEATGKTFEIRSGGFLPEMLDRWHHGENRGSTPVRLLAIDQVPDGVSGNMVMKPEQ